MMTPDELNELQYFVDDCVARSYPCSARGLTKAIADAASYARLAREAQESAETHIMQLAAISTASIQNTPRTRGDRITKASPYWSQAYADVCAAVDREMDWREKYKALANAEPNPWHVGDRWRSPAGTIWEVAGVNEKGLGLLVMLEPCHSARAYTQRGVPEGWVKILDAKARDEALARAAQSKSLGSTPHRCCRCEHFSPPVGEDSAGFCPVFHRFKGENAGDGCMTFTPRKTSGQDCA